MKSLIDYVLAHTERGACQCGKCFDAPINPELEQPQGHTVNLTFFEVAVKNSPDADKLRELILANKKGSWAEVNPLDGKEHNYIELGAWIGDQGLAIMLMGLGKLLGLWELITPDIMLGEDAPEDLKQSMAQAGMVTIHNGK